MPLAFGTSGLRGPIDALTPAAVAAYVRAFFETCPTDRPLFVGRDLRASSPEIAAQVGAAARTCGIDTVDCGVLPTPALALAAMAQAAPAIMVTGSHIPADRNGLKFYRADGEITKADEVAIRTAVTRGAGRSVGEGRARADPGAVAGYMRRYRAAFGDGALAGLRLGVYEHSSAARQVLGAILAALGAEVVPLGRTDEFVAVDTEAVDDATREMLRGWCAERRLDAIVSTDGDGDRPLVDDASGDLVAGDVLGVLTARALAAGAVCTPVTSNTMVSVPGVFDAVTLTRIGSPYVLAAMDAEIARDPSARVVGFEANGGFVLGFTAQLAAGPLAPLMTRDAMLPILAPLVAARAAGKSLSELVAELPPRATAADRLQGVASAPAQSFLAALSQDTHARAAFFSQTGEIAKVDLTDGLRATFVSGEIVHLRPSGNAPEFRVYAEADGPVAAQALMRTYLGKTRAALG